MVDKPTVDIPKEIDYQALFEDFRKKLHQYGYSMDDFKELQLSEIEGLGPSEDKEAWLYAIILSEREGGTRRWFGCPYGKPPYGFVKEIDQDMEELDITGVGSPPIKRRMEGGETAIRYGTKEYHNLTLSDSLLNVLGKVVIRYTYDQTIVPKVTARKIAMDTIEGMRDILIGKFSQAGKVDARVIGMWEAVKRNVIYLPLGNKSGITTMAVDGLNLYIVPHFSIYFGLKEAIIEFAKTGKVPDNDRINRVISDTVAGIIAHELFHNIQMHTDFKARFGSQNNTYTEEMAEYHRLTNISEDHEINAQLTNMGVSTSLERNGIRKVINGIDIPDINFRKFLDKLSTSRRADLSRLGSPLTIDQLKDLYLPQAELWVNVYNRDYMALTPFEISSGIKILLDRYKGVKQVKISTDNKSTSDVDKKTDELEEQMTPQTTPTVLHYGWEVGDIYRHPSDDKFGAVVDVFEDDADAKKDYIKVVWGDSLTKRVKEVRRMTDMDEDPQKVMGAFQTLRIEIDSIIQQYASTGGGAVTI